MDLKNISNEELINRMQKLVRTERKITHLILLHILEIETRRIYAELGFDGMYTYLTRGLGYSEGSAYRRLQSARLLKQVPEVAEKIESGSLHLSQLTRVQKCITNSITDGRILTPSVTLEIIEKLENKNSFETEKILAENFDLPVQNLEVLKPQKDQSVRLEITLTAEQFKQLETSKSLLSHVCFDSSWSEVIAALAEKFNSKTLGKVKEELEVKTAAMVRPSTIESALKTSVAPTQSAIATKTVRRKYLSAKIKRSLHLQADGCCEYVHGNGRRCESKYQLQIDHILPVALGGTNSPENLRILCRTHNLLMASQMGLDTVRNYSNASHPG